jgi:glutamine---fructose-6-phosphate transaminase (isomerizing)
MANPIARLNLADTARELSALLEQRNSYEKVIRDTHWTDGTLTIIGRGASRVAALAAARAFEWLLGWPVAVREASEFGSYALPNLRPRSLLIAVSPSGEDLDLLETVKKAHQRGAAVLALTRNVESSLGKACRSTFALPCVEESEPAVRTTFLEQAALLYVACLAASIFNPRHTIAGTWEGEFGGLPDRLQWVHAHLGDAVQAVAETVRQATDTIVTGAGLYHASALQGARLAWQLSGRHTHAFQARELLDGAPGQIGEADVVLVLSGSSCRAKQRVHSAAAQLKDKNVRILAVTDNNDQEVVRVSSMAILLPAFSEIAGCLLELAVVQWIMARAWAK